MPRFFKPHKKQTKGFTRIDEPLLIENLSDDGRGIAHYQGKIVFVEGGLPGEHITVQVTAQSSRFLEAKSLVVQSSSEYRVQAACNHAEYCGGCSAQHMSHDKQRDFKAQALSKQLQQNKVNSHPTFETLYGDAFAYRNRIRLGVSVSNNGETTFGFRQKQSQQLVDIKECQVIVPALGQLIQPLSKWLRSLNNAPVTHVELVGHGNSYGVVIRHTRSIKNESKHAITDDLMNLGAQTWFQASKHGSLQNEQGEYIDPRLHYTLVGAAGELCLQYHPQDFIQANPVVNEKMIKQALSLLKPQPSECFADLFCGIGNFSLPLSKHVKAVYGFEGVQTMVDRAAANAEANQCLNTHFSQSDLGAKDASVYDMPPIDGMLLDPPRTGAKSICTHISKLVPERIVYISCNPATFARDAHILCGNDYQLVLNGTVDMFPQTSHSEVIALFERS